MNGMKGFAGARSLSGLRVLRVALKGLSFLPHMHGGRFQNVSMASMPSPAWPHTGAGLASGQTQTLGLVTTHPCPKVCGRVAPNNFQEHVRHRSPNQLSWEKAVFIVGQLLWVPRPYVVTGVIGPSGEPSRVLASAPH